ncbi:hypothetical protein NC652_021316 [Populus alba x Populus x berolinensis]|uniref:Uncharacterized protein n=1 Tax=Populus alba x Populus x berolinensis TaxID=444605 RepID=A0AAD6QD69_9ROSI|nr:hypothetical protein NC652_021316 [Populus alba x Populus x berolinensis]KAJ6988026.1 hypothetical protein NC653_021072 [Populus alba x Populus x berolinensis]
MELEFKGSPHIWTNRHTGRHDRLDRAQAPPERLYRFPKAFMLYENHMGSDHRPIVVCLDADNR